MNSLGGQTVVTGAGHLLARPDEPTSGGTKSRRLLSGGGGVTVTSISQQPTVGKDLSLSSLVSQVNTYQQQPAAAAATTTGGQKQQSGQRLAVSPAGPIKSKQSGYLMSNASFQLAQQQARSANKQQASYPSGCTTPSASSSTAQLNSGSSGGGGGGRLNVSKRLSLKYVKTLIIALLAIDLAITVLVHQFAQQDTISLGPLLSSVTYKLRLSTLNLCLSSLWFILLIGAILFEVYALLFLGCLLNACSFLLLLAFSLLHFTQRIDYNSVHLTSLLLLLFAVTILHVYLLAMTALMAYLMLAVKRRQRARR